MGTERRALVFGGTGFLGRHVVIALRDAGYETVSVSRSAAGHGVVLDLAATDTGTLKELLADLRPELLVNSAGVAWQKDDKEMRRMNARFAARLAVAAAGSPLRPRLVHLGTVHEYGPVPAGTLIAETQLPAPSGAYGRTKLLGTRAVLDTARERGLSAAVLRVVNVCGPGAPATSLLGLVCAHLARSATKAQAQPLRVAPLVARRDFVDARDVADAVLAAAAASDDALADPLFNIGRGEAVSVRSLVDRLVALSGFRVPVLEESTSPVGNAAGSDWHRVDVARARDLLAWKPRRTLEESLRDQLDAV
ncbi:NAD-dependent epimerase/dehydratase family protein [Streptomyces sp. NPDC059639]|uniref:NAD-dependent epimerase/dehydratase family protein n=1 Tax=Streptomyces sp. NPDC059639 TaxID=3346891 RepID=UPI0036954221